MSGVNIFQAGTNGPFQLNGVFNVFNVRSGSIPSPSQLNSNFAILNPAAGASYVWGVNGNLVTLQISGLAFTATSWVTNGGGQWGITGNWTAGPPSAAGDAAVFGNAVTTPGTVNITFRRRSNGRFALLQQYVRGVVLDQSRQRWLADLGRRREVLLLSAWPTAAIASPQTSR